MSTPRNTDATAKIEAILRAAGYPDDAAVLAASEADLAAIEGIGPIAAARILRELHVAPKS